MPEVSKEKLDQYREFCFKKGMEAAFRSPVLTNFLSKSRTLNVALFESNTTMFGDEYKDFRMALNAILKAIDKMEMIEAIDPDNLPSGLHQMYLVK